MAGRKTPHRFGLNDLAPKGVRVTPSQALDMLAGSGLDDVTADDLEVYRLVMTPASFRLLEQRLADALAEHANQPRPTEEMPLPFGVDVAGEIERERVARLRAHDPVTGLLACWTTHTEFQVPGKLKLVEGREFSAWGLRGRLLFRWAVTTDRGDCWVDGWDEDGRCRSIDVVRIKTVHRKPLRGSLRDRLAS